jgi:hypothetical protein
MQKQNLMLNHPLLWLATLLIFAGWFTYLLQACLSQAKQQALAGTPTNKIEGVHLFPVFPILPGLVCLCMWSFQPPLGLPWLSAICAVHLGVFASSIPRCTRTWKWLQQQEQDRGKSS